MYRFSLRVLAEMFRDIANWERLPEDLRVGAKVSFGRSRVLRTSLPAMASPVSCASTRR
jgi:hypothetical protein